jgi:hypothetical protein
MSQQALADAMKRKGWKWSQATVWSIEKGERPLRLIEAVDLVEILDLEGVYELTVTPLVTMGWQRLASMSDRVTELHAATLGFLRAQEELAKVADALEASGLALPSAEDDEVDFYLGMRPEEVVDRAGRLHTATAGDIVAFHERDPEGGALLNDGRYLRVLIETNPAHHGAKGGESDGEHQAAPER